MSSAAKLAANRANATRSTGPADTSRTRFNGLAHGLTSKQTVIRGEDQNEYDAFSINLRRRLAPGSPTEDVLADRIIAAAWRLKRFARIETAFFNDQIDSFLEENPGSGVDCALAILFSDPARMNRMRLFLRYQTTVQREYDNAMRQFQKEQADRSHDDRERTYMEMILAGNSEKPKPVTAVSVSVNADPCTVIGFASQSTNSASRSPAISSVTETHVE